MTKDKIKKLEIHIGDMLNTYEITFQNKKLIYKRFLGGYQSRTIEEITPTKKQWQKFLLEIEELGVQNWKPDYWKPALDGIGWSVEIESEKLKVSSSGSNAYPKNFQSCLKAVSRLLGESDLDNSIRYAVKMLS